MTVAGRQDVRVAHRRARRIRRVHQRIAVRSQHRVGRVRHIRRTRSQRHRLVDTQHRVSDRALQIRRVRRAGVVQRDRVRHVVSHLAGRITGLGERDRRLDQIHIAGICSRQGPFSTSPGQVARSIDGVRQGIRITRLHRVGRVRLIRRTRCQRHLLVDPQQLVGDRAVQIRSTGTTEVVQSNGVVNLIADL